MQQPGSIGDFLDSSGARYRLFDLGSQLRKLDRDAWRRFDQGGPYPYPHLNHAWLVLLLWNPEDSDQHSIWFMKLPLDEQAGLPAAVHSDVLNRLFKALATRDPAERQRLLTDHPYQFTPEAGKMAALHARAGRILGAPPSGYYSAARDYLLGDGQPEDWESLGLQGIAEVLERADEADQRRLAGRLDELPREPRLAVLRALEHQQPVTALSEAIIALAERGADPDLESAALRALSQSPAQGLVRAFAGRALERHPDDLDLVLALLSRHPALLADTELSLVALDQLARLADTDGFNRVVQGLALQPDLAGLVLQVLRHPDRSEALARAIGGLIEPRRPLH